MLAQRDSIPSTSIASPTIIWVCVGNVSKQSLLGWFKPPLRTIVKQLQAGEKLIVLRQLYVAAEQV